MEDHDFQVVRKNLNILSVVLLVLAFTNSRISNLDLLGMSMELDGPKLYIALYIAYLYFIWRFLTKLAFRTGFWNDFCQFFINQPDGLLKEHTFDRYRAQLMVDSDRLREAIEQKDPNFAVAGWGATRQTSDTIRKLDLVLRFRASFTPGQTTNSTNLSASCQIVVSRRYLWAKVIKFCVKYDSFGDYLFPLVPVILVLLFFFLKPSWQGSFHSFFC